MTDNVNPTGGNSRSEYDGEKVVTMMDVLQEQEAFEEDANAVLGASDDKNCTYPKGYVKRQAIYACLTCCPDAKNDDSKRAGVCLACSLHCHENHDLVELYTKRLFRCDCGNPNFNGHACNFTPNKTDLNWDNNYNQNFSGLYCTCHRPYPDPEAADEEEMIQCIICEDWLHYNHLEATVPDNDQYAEMICKNCMEDNDFLHDYTDIVVNVTDKEVEVYDPDLDVSDVMEALKREKEKLANGVAEEKVKPTAEAENAETDKTVENGDAEIEKAKKSETTTETEATKIGDKPSEVTNEEKSVTEPTTTTTTETKNPEIPKENTDVATEKEAEKSEPTTEIPEKMDEDEPQDETPKPDKPKPNDTGVTEPSGDNTEPKQDSTTPEEPVSTSEETKTTEPTNEGKRKLSTEEPIEDTSAKKPKLDENKCIRPRGVKRSYKGATFWPSTFRQKLCTCGECLDMYKDLAVLFLTDLDDTVTAYEALGKERVDGPASQYEKGLQALSSLDRVHQINAMTEYNKMRDKLLDFLKNFKDRKEVVKEEDIKEFFAGMKPKREPDGVYFCR